MEGTMEICTHLCTTRWDLTVHRNPDPHLYLVDSKVVRCLGWKHDASVYTEGSQPLMQPNHKFAALSNEWESLNMPGLFFVGGLC